MPTKELTPMNKANPFALILQRSINTPIEEEPVPEESQSDLLKVFQSLQAHQNEQMALLRQ